MLTANLPNGQLLIGDAAIKDLMRGFNGAGLAGTAQVQELQQALRAYGQSAGHQSAAAVQPTGQLDLQTLQAIGSLAPQLRERVPGQIPDALWTLLIAVGASPTKVATGQLNAQVGTYAGLLAEAVRALTMARMTGNAVMPVVKRPFINALAGLGEDADKPKVPTWIWIAGGITVAGIAAYFIFRSR